MEVQQNPSQSNEALLDVECMTTLLSEINECAEAPIAEEVCPPTPVKNSKNKENTLHKALSEKIEIPEKILFLLEIMEGCLKQVEPRFKRFWEAKEALLPLFKADFPQKDKQTLWERYREISSNALTLKKSLQEKNSFAFEQIEIALEGIKKEFEVFQEKGELNFVDPLAIICFSLTRNKNLYQKLYKETLFLNSLAAKMHGLRKELSKMEGGGKGRSSVFTLLSTLSDAIFPQRRKSIQEVNSLFREDVGAFIQEHFTEGYFKKPFFALKEEIKGLQDFAKVLPLDAPTFSETRLSLSTFWDKIKEEEKEKKKLRQDQKVLYEENFTFIGQEIEAFTKELETSQENNTFSPYDLERKLDTLYSLMRERELGKDELKELRNSLQNAKKSFNSLLKEAEKKKKEHAENELLLKDQKENALKNAFIEKQRALLETVVNASNKEVLEEAEKTCKELVSELKKSGFSSKDKRELEAFFETYKDAAFSQRSKWVIPESDGEKEIKEALKEQKERRVNLKKEIDILKGSASNLNFIEALEHNEKIAKQKSHLETIDALIKTLEDKLISLQ